jgi:thiamine-monophosphate kinase
VRLSELGEQGLLDRIRARVVHKGVDVVLGIGDDSCAVRFSPDLLTLVTTDAFVEGNHFDLTYFTLEEVGIKAAAASLSDVAAMGGAPKYCLVSLMAPGTISVADVDRMVEGIVGCCEKYGVELVGGDMVGAPCLCLSLTILGEAKPANMALRSGAKAGDIVYVTGDLGASEAGRLALSLGAPVPDETREYLATRHKRPVPRILEAKELVRRFRIHSMIDLSDGLSTDASHIARESGVKLLLDASSIPISPHVKALARAAGTTALDLALHGGEDFELLFTGAGSELKELKGTPVTKVGRVVEGAGVDLFTPDGAETPLSSKGYEHF